MSVLGQQDIIRPIETAASSRTLSLSALEDWVVKAQTGFTEFIDAGEATLFKSLLW